MSLESGTNPPLWRQGYAVFVKLWDLDPDSPADEACALIDTLDEALLSTLGGNKHRWFQNPYGGSAFFPDVDMCLTSISQVMAALDQAGALISIGVAWGNFERNFSVSAWNTSGVAINTAARLATIQGVQGCAVVDPKVRNDLLNSRVRYGHLFGTEQTGIAKGAQFRYYLLAEPYRQNPRRPTPNALQPNETPSTPANIVSFDIERYSQQSQSEQAELSIRLFRCVEESLASVGKRGDSWTPAGDGGQLVFASSSQNSAPQAWQFGWSIFQLAFESGLRLRIGIDNGPVSRSKHRAAIGGALLRADQVSSSAKAHGIAVSREFWAGLPDGFKKDVRIMPSSEVDSGVLCVFGSHPRRNKVSRYELFSAVALVIVLIAISRRSVICTYFVGLLIVVVGSIFVRRGPKSSEAPTSRAGFRLRMQGKWRALASSLILLIACSLYISLPALAGIFSNRAVQYQRAGNLTAALTNYEWAVRFDSEDAVTLYNLGSLYEHIFQIDLAAAEYRASVRADPHFYFAYNNLARLNLTRNQYGDALNIVNSALDLNPPEVQVRYALLKNRAWAHLGLQLYDLAGQDLGAAIRLQPDRAAAHCLLAQVLEAKYGKISATREWEDCLRYAPGENDVESSWISTARNRLARSKQN